MSSRVQFKSVASTFGTSHSVSFDSPVAAGNTAVLIVYLDNARTVSNVATTGNVQAISAADTTYVVTAPALKFIAYSLNNCPSGVTGFSLSTDSNADVNYMVFELSGVGAYGASGGAQLAFTDTITVSVTTTGTDGQLVGGMARGAAFSSNGANTVSENTSNPSAVINNTALGSAGSKSLVMNLSTAGASSGFAVWYPEAAAAANQLISSGLIL